MGREARTKEAARQARTAEFEKLTPLQQVKRATVAIAMMRGVKGPTRYQPFDIVGSGFCVDERGVVVTCRHVLEGFLEKTIGEQIASISETERVKAVQAISGVKAVAPYALFFVPEPQDKIAVACVSMTICIASTDADICVARVAHHEMFDKFPTIALEDFEQVHEGMEVLTCGFPLGNLLYEQLGTVTSSFSRGIVSSIIPSASASRKLVKGFQLDLRATHGNSGGPVFCSKTGKAFGILAGGIPDAYGHHLFSRAESVYFATDTGMIDNALRAPEQPPPT